MSMLKFFRIPFATSGDKVAVPDDSQPSGSVSYTDGFGVDYELDPGVDPAAKDVPRDESNQLYFDITNAIAELQSFGTPDFITSVLNGGAPFSYAKYARVLYSDGSVYVSKKNANTSLPTVAADWYKLTDNADYLAIATTAFEASVTDGEAVYWDSANSQFDEAVADGTTKQNMIGFADVTNGRVFVYGLMAGLVSGLTGNTKYYLSPVTPGAITAALPATNIISVGVTKSATDLFVAVTPQNAGVLVAGQCVLTKSGANLLLSPYNGNKLVIDSVPQSVPDAGITLAPPATTLTLYYIYAYMNAGVMTLEASATVPATQAGTGIKIKTGDATRSLVGMARTVTNAWVDTRAQRFVRSWFGQRATEGGNAFAANRSTTSSTYVELSSAERFEFLSWLGEIVALATSGRMSNSIAGGLTVDVSIGIDSAAPLDTWGAFKIPTGGINFTAPAASAAKVSNLTEGYHYATILGGTLDAGGGTCTYFGSATPGARTVINGTLG
jgi:hypothetical protein